MDGTPGTLPRRATRGCIVAIGLVVVLSYAVVAPALRSRSKRLAAQDLAAALPFTGAGRIEALVAPPTITDGKVVKPALLIRVSGQLVTYAWPHKGPAPGEGVGIRVHGRRGPSGHVYIDSIEPAPTP